MNPTLVILLLFFWLFLAYRSFARGDMTMAIVFLVVGVAITAYRFKGRPKSPGS